MTNYTQHDFTDTYSTMRLEPLPNDPVIPYGWTTEAHLCGYKYRGNDITDS
jgi:hypothetical protein